MSRNLPSLPARLLAAEVETTVDPVLVMVSGLPDSGKSYLARRLAVELRAIVVESDRVRKALFPEPGYSAQESLANHGACREIIQLLLSRGVRVIYDTTNLVEIQREVVYNLAERNGAWLLIVHVVCPPGVTCERLELRNIHNDNLSDADRRVYVQMVESEQPILRSHTPVDTSQDVESSIANIVRQVQRHRSRL